MKLRLKASQMKSKTLKLKDLLEYAGGPEKVRKHCYDAPIAHRFLSKHQEKLVSELKEQGYTSIDMVSNSVIAKWADEFFGGE